MKPNKAIVVLIIALIASPLISGCVTHEKKLPAIEVCFEHYVAGNKHILKIDYAKATLISKKEAPTLYPWYNTPMTGIILFAYDMTGVKSMKELGMRVTPSTFVPLSKQGKIVAYIGFKSPKDVPKKGDKMLVVVQVLENGREIAEAHTNVVWDINWS